MSRLGQVGQIVLGVLSTQVVIGFPGSPPADKTRWPWNEATLDLPSVTPAGTARPRVSIVTISCNQANFIEETLRSVLLQGYPGLEYIVIDGGSTDGTVDLIRKYERWLAYWVSEPDRGQSHAINKGFERCTGEIVTFLSSDDIYLPGTLAHVAALWPRLNRYGAIVGAFFFMDESSAVQGEAIRPCLREEGPLDLTLGPPGGYRLHQVAMFYTRQALDDVGRWVREDMKYVMDRELLYRVCRKYPLLVVDRPYGAFRRHPGSKSAAHILPFAREFAKLYTLNLSGNPVEDQKRKAMARYRLARGYMKYAKAVNSRFQAAWALVRAAAVEPRYLTQGHYVKAWVDICRPRRTE